jgi:Bacterial Ig-like domain (group 3)
MSASKLRAGTYHLSASYGGDVNYSPSTSSAKTLKVAA